MKLVLASSNPGKLREFSALLGPFGYELVNQAALGIDSPPETGVTFAENALLKARHASFHAGLPALADDSGIEVDALCGGPGVRSARYASDRATDRENLGKMLTALQGVPAERRTARYRCVIVLVRGPDDLHPLVATGTWQGSILETSRGSHGFGYDPVFLPAGLSYSAAELDPVEKNLLSHRAQALQALVSQLKCPR